MLLIYVLVHIYWNRCSCPNYQLLNLCFSKHIRYYSNLNMHCIWKYQKNKIPLENSFYDLAHYHKEQVFDFSKFSFRVSGALENQNFPTCSQPWWLQRKSHKPFRFLQIFLIARLMSVVLTLRDIYINSNLNQHTKFTSSSKSTWLKDIFPWNISQMITKTVPISTRIVLSYTMKWGILLQVW